MKLSIISVVIIAVNEQANALSAKENSDKVTMSAGHMRGTIANLNLNHARLSNLIAEITVTGTVRDAKGQYLPSITVKVKNTTIGIATDANGHFKLKVPDHDVVLVFSAVGYVTQEVAIGTKTAVDIVLQENGKNLEEIVVVAYGTQKKTSSTAAVSAVKGDVLAASPVANISSSLAGNVAGVSMRPNGAQPGNDNPDIHIRGIGTTGSNGPLIVVDGVQRNNINQIDPEAIDNVTVLKDAAAVAPYGLGGANGVLLITTKRGKLGAPTLTLNSYYGIQTPTYVPKPLNAQDYMSLTNEAYLNDNLGLANPTLPYTPTLISNYQSLHNNNPVLYPSSNAVADVPKYHSPMTQTDLQITGGTDAVKYFAGVGILNQDGMFDQVNYRRYNYNMNLDVTATSTTSVRLSLSGAFENNNSIDASTGVPQMFRAMLKYLPTQTLQFPNGDYGASAGNSPLGVLNSGGYYRKNQTTELMSISIEQKLPFIKGLSIKGVFSYDPYNYVEKGWHEPYYYSTVNTNATPYVYSQSIATSEGAATQTTSLYQNYWSNNSFTYQGFLNYHNTFGKSDITGLLVAEERNNVQQQFGASLNNYQVGIDELNFGSSNANDRGLNGSSSTGSQVGYVYRINYGYDNKYLLEASGRYDGHYYFAPGHQYAYFPAFSAGWVMSNESFMKSATFIDYLKVRGSWGRSGNLAGSAFQYLSGYNLYGNSYAFGSGTVVQGSYQPQEANPNITWEISTKTNAGFEATLWKGLLKVEADYFWERRTGMLLAPAVTVPVEYGLSLAQQNAGIMDNHGFEFTLSSQHHFDNGLSLALNGNFSYSRNKLVQTFEDPSEYANPNRRRTGRPLGEVFGYKAIKIFTTADDKNGDGIIDSKDGYNVTQFGALHPGDIEYQDTNHDGKIDINDQVPIGNPNYPAISYGFTPTVSYKGFDLALFFQGSAMESMNINGDFQVLPFSSNNSNTSYQYFNNRWTPTNQNSLYPRVTESPYANNTQTSSWWQIDNSYLRLKTATLGYTFASSIAKRIGMSRLRIYVTAQNYLTFSKLNFIDPEAGYTNGETAYPTQKIIITGLNASF